MSVRKVSGETEGSLEGNHDNPVSGTHHAPSHWEPQWRNAQTLTKKKHPKGRALGKEAGGKNSLVKLLHTKAT